MLAIPPGAYPLRGLAYLCTHPRLNTKVGGFLAGVSALCIAGIIALALLTFHIQLHFIGQSFIGVGVLGKIATCLLILAEASLPVYLIFKQTMQVLHRRLFLDVLHGMNSVSLQGTGELYNLQVQPSCLAAGHNNVKVSCYFFAKCIHAASASADQGVFAVRSLTETEKAGLHAYMQSPAVQQTNEQEDRSSLRGIAMRGAQTIAMTAMTSAPASIVPMLPVLISLLSGDKATVPFMSHYLHMRGLKSYAEQQAVADTHKLAYTQFGIVAAFLTSVPIASWAFVFSNTVGAALWAADLEKRDVQLFADQTQP